MILAKYIEKGAAAGGEHNCWEEEEGHSSTATGAEWYGPSPTFVSRTLPLTHHRSRRTLDPQNDED
jgi:hypothetical protein